MSTQIKNLSIALLLGCALPVYAADNTTDIPPPPDEVMQEEGKDKHLPEPEVTIIKRKDATIEEVRVNGKLRYAKITPAKGPAYYMVDTDGDGLLDSRHNDLSDPPVQQWILMRW